MYLLVLVLFYAIAILPFPLLYALSDGIYFILYYLVGYRKKVVLDNLAKSFPSYSEADRVAIAKKFYRNFCDQWLETIKLLTMSKACMNKRMVGNWEVLDTIKITQLYVPVSNDVWMVKNQLIYFNSNRTKFT